MPRSATRRELLAGAAAAATAATAGCTGDADLSETAEVDRTIAVEDAGALAVETTAGEVAVRSADRSDVHVSGVKRGTDQDALDAVELRERSEDGRLVLERVGEADSWLPGASPRAQLELEVEVPRDLQVATVETTAGRVQVEDVTGPTSASATSGVVDLSGVDGAVSADVSAGEVGLDGTLGTVAVTTGRVDASVRDVASDASVEATTGEVDLAVESGLDVRLVVETDAGDVVVDGAFERSERESGETVATLGDGSQRVPVSTTAGDVTLSTL